MIILNILVLYCLNLSGIKPKISHTVEHLCSSGSSAVISGFSYIASGLADTVLVTGADKIGNPGQILKWDKSRGEYDHVQFTGHLCLQKHTKDNLVQQMKN